MGRNYYMQADYRKATDAMEKAFAMEPANAEYALWLGRAFRQPRRDVEPVHGAWAGFHARAVL